MHARPGAALRPPSGLASIFTCASRLRRLASAVVTRGSSGKPMRQIRTAWSDEWNAPDAPKPLKMPYQDILVGSIVQAAEEHGIAPLMHQPAGQSVAWCSERRSVEAEIRRIMQEADMTRTALCLNI